MTGRQKTALRTNTFPLATFTSDVESYSMIRQGPATNQLSRVNVRRNDPLKVDDYTGRSTVSHEDLTVSFSTGALARDMKTSTQMLLDALIGILTEEGAGSTLVTIDLGDYMALRGLRDRKEARAQVKKDLEVIFDAQISFEAAKGKGKNKEKAFLDMRIVDAKGIDTRGQIFVNFAPTFFGMISKYPVMPYSKDLLKINSKRNPFAYSLGRKVLELKNMNAGKPSEDIISVKTLLKAADGIPSYKEVMASDCAVSRRIIEPFERDLNACENLFTWEYCHSKGAPLADDELGEMSYSQFERLYIHVFWRNYPDQTLRLEAKKAIAAKRKAEASKSGAAAGKSRG